MATGVVPTNWLLLRSSTDSAGRKYRSSTTVPEKRLFDSLTDFKLLISVTLGGSRPVSWLWLMSRYSRILALTSA